MNNGYSYENLKRYYEGKYFESFNVEREEVYPVVISFRHKFNNLVSFQLKGLYIGNKSTSLAALQVNKKIDSQEEFDSVKEKFERKYASLLLDFYIALITTFMKLENKKLEEQEIKGMADNFLSNYGNVSLAKAYNLVLQKLFSKNVKIEALKAVNEDILNVKMSYMNRADYKVLEYYINKVLAASKWQLKSIIVNECFSDIEERFNNKNYEVEIDKVKKSIDDLFIKQNNIMNSKPILKSYIINLKDNGLINDYAYAILNKRIEEIDSFTSYEMYYDSMLSILDLVGKTIKDRIVFELKNLDELSMVDALEVLELLDDLVQDKYKFYSLLFTRLRFINLKQDISTTIFQLKDALSKEKVEKRVLKNC